MAYELVQSGNTQFAIDWDVIQRLLRSYWTAKLQLYYGKEVTLSDSHWYNPFSWSLPDVSHIEVDWESVRSEAASNAEQEVKSMRERAKFNAAGVAWELDARIEEAGLLKERFVDWMGDIQTKNSLNINKAVDDYEENIEIAKFVRNTSADGLMVGASVMSGGAAVAVMGAGSILKGEGKYQDTGSVGAGVMEGAGSFVFAYVKLGKKFSFKQDMVLALVQAPYKAGTELVSGASFSKAALSGALKLTGPGVDRLFTMGLGKTLFDKVAVPIVINVNKGDVVENVASKFLGKLTGKIAQGFGVEKKGKEWLLNSSAPQSAASQTAYKRSPLIDEATLTNKYLLYLAFVNMSNGIGRGW